MKVTVFGATGRTGRELVRQALAKDHQVTAVVRDPARLQISDERLRVERADVFDPRSIEPAVRGSDAVVSALGGTSLKPTDICESGVRAVIRAMNATGARRLAVVSNSAHTSAEGDSPLKRAANALLVRRILRNPFADLRRMEREIRASDVDWTIVRPPRLTDGAHTGRYRTTRNAHVAGGWTISRADVADCVLAVLEGDTGSVRTFVGVAY
jgi:putative NADH-flavin reductase